MASKTEQLFEAAGITFPRSPARRQAENHLAAATALDAAKAKRAAAAIRLASLTAYGFNVSRDDELAAAFRTADADVKTATAAYARATA